MFRIVTKYKRIHLTLKKYSYDPYGVYFTLVIKVRSQDISLNDWWKEKNHIILIQSSKLQHVTWMQKYALESIDVVIHDALVSMSDRKSRGCDHMLIQVGQLSANVCTFIYFTLITKKAQSYFYRHLFESTNVRVLRCGKHCQPWIAGRLSSICWSWEANLGHSSDKQDTWLCAILASTGESLRWSTPAHDQFDIILIV